MFLRRAMILLADSHGVSLVKNILTDTVVSKNANVSEERALFPEHNGGNPIFLSRLILLLGQFF